MEEALRRAILAGDNLLAELEAHQENTGEPLIEEDQAVVYGAKQDLDFARAALTAKLNSEALVEALKRARTHVAFVSEAHAYLSSDLADARETLTQIDAALASIA